MHINRSKIKRNRTVKDGLKENVVLSDSMTEEKKWEAVLKEAKQTAPSNMQSPLQEENESLKAEQPRKKGRMSAWIFLAVILAVLLFGAAFKVLLDRSFSPSGSVSISGEGFNMENTDNLLSVTNPVARGAAEKTGLILFADQQVEPECYLPLMNQLASYGYPCYLPKAFGNLPVLNITGADSVIRKYPDIERWYLIAHSRSADIAALYAGNHEETVLGLIFLGGLTSLDLSDSGLSVLSLFGSNDTVTDASARSLSEQKYPENRTVQMIPGGNNTGFLDLASLLPSDSRADITPEEQIALTAQSIDRYLREEVR